MGRQWSTALDVQLRTQTRLECGCAALQQGILPGGGAALLHLAEFVPEFLETLTDSEERLGADILRKSLT